MRTFVEIIFPKGKQTDELIFREVLREVLNEQVHIVLRSHRCATGAFSGQSAAGYQFGNRVNQSPLEHSRVLELKEANINIELVSRSLLTVDRQRP